MKKVPLSFLEVTFGGQSCTVGSSSDNEGASSTMASSFAAAHVDRGKHLESRLISAAAFFMFLSLFADPAVSFFLDKDARRDPVFILSALQRSTKSQQRLLCLWKVMSLFLLPSAINLKRFLTRQESCQHILYRRSCLKVVIVN